MLSLVAWWTLPAAGFQAYVEWARNDHSWNLRDLVLEPDHARAYTIGFQTWFAAHETFHSHQTELSLGLRGMRFVGPLEVSGSLTLSRELNRYYLEFNDVTNVMLTHGARWRTGLAALS